MRFYHTLFVKLFVSFLLLSTIPLLLTGLVTYQNVANSLNLQLESEAESTLNGNFNKLSLYLNDLKRMGDSIAVSPIVSDFLKNNNEDAYYPFFPRMDETINSAHLIRPENVGITIVNEYGYVYYYGYSLNRNDDDFTSFDWLPDQSSYHEGTYVTAVHSRPYNHFVDDLPVFSFVRQLYSNDLRSKGQLIIDFKLDALNRLFTTDSSTKKSNDGLLQFYVQDQLGKLVYPNDSLHNGMPNDLSKYQLVQQSDPSLGWTMSAYFLKKKWYEPVDKIRKTFLKITIMSSLICLLVSLLISTRFSKPIKQLRLLMKQVETGDFELQFKIQSKDEIGSLGIGFNHMVKKIKELITLVYREQNEKRRAEIAALQAQINPHFLYNTLETINSLARKSKEQQISKMIVLLGKLLRISISNFDEMVPISQELEYVKHYLAIHKLRLNKQIDYSIDVDERIYRLYTVKWIFQPIIENAIIHGLDRKSDGGSIHIVGWLEEDEVWFQIIDQGIGMPTERLIALQEALDNDYEQLSRNQRNIGLFNVQSRIKLHFGRTYGISIASVPYQGTTVTIKLPRRDHHEELQAIDRG